MGIQIGTTFSGTVEELGNESIQTKFFMIGVPLIPLQSFFVLRQRGDAIDGFPIPLNGKSVLLAYVRMGTFVAAVVGGVVAFVVHHHTPADFVFPVIATAAWVASTFFFGKPSAASRERRLVLKAATGISAEPSMLPMETAQKFQAVLLETPAPTNPAWRFAVAAYQAALVPDEANRRAEEEAWATVAGAPSGASGRLIADNLNR